MHMESEVIKNIQELKTLVLDALKRTSQGKLVKRSDSFNELAAALALAQSEYKPVVLDGVNTYTQIAYASLSSVTKATREALTKNNLSIVQDIIDHEDGSSVLHTLLLHTSDQYIESQMRLKPNNNDPHSLTSYINWAKRTAYAALVGCPIPNEDDDAENSVAKERNLPARGSALKKKDLGFEVISSDQLAELEYELNGFPTIAEQIMDTYNLQNIADLPKEKYRTCITRVREIKLKLREN